MPEYNPNAKLDTSQIRDIRGSHMLRRGRGAGVSSNRRLAAIRRLRRFKKQQRNKQREINY